MADAGDFTDATPESGPAWPFPCNGCPSPGYCSANGCQKDGVEARAEPWWNAVDARVRKLARLICSKTWGDGSADEWVLPYTPAVHGAPGGTVSAVRVADLRPFWSCYVDIARAALEFADETPETEPDTPDFDPDSLTIPPFPDTIAIPRTPEQAWREESGLNNV